MRKSSVIAIVFIVSCIFLFPVLIYSEDKIPEKGNNLIYDAVPPQGEQDSVILQDEQTGKDIVTDSNPESGEVTEDILDDGKFQD